MAENQTKDPFSWLAPTMAFETICDEMGTEDAKETYKQVNWTTNTYRKYLNGYKKALEKKSSVFRLISSNKTELTTGKPSVKIWKVLPKNVIRINDSNMGWYCCPDLSDCLEEGDTINVFKGREGRREINSDNFRKVKGQYQFKFPELAETHCIIVDGESYTVESTFDSISENPDVSVGGRKVTCEKINDTTVAVYSILRGTLTLDGKNVDYIVEKKEDIPPLSKLFDDGYLVFSAIKPSSGISKDITEDLLKSLSPSEYRLGDKLLSEQGFERDGINRFVSDSCGFIEEKTMVPDEYPEVVIPISVHSARGRWYKIKMPNNYDVESSTDPRMAIFEDNAIITHDKTKLAVKNKDLDEMLVEFYEYMDSRDRKSVDLGKTAEISVKFNTRDISNQLSALESLRDNAPPELTPLINMFRKSEGKGNWRGFRLMSKPKYGWRVLYDDDYNGVDEQRNFVKKALSTPDFAILDGPPGTGKTTAIRELIIQLILDGKRVLVASSTNAAIDNVLDRIVNIDCKKEENQDFRDALRPIRLGIAEKASDDVKEYSMEVMINNNSSSEMDEMLLKRTLIDSSNLVCGTIAKVYSDLIFIAGNEDKWKRKLAILPTFDYLIMDESSKTTFQEFIVPAKLAKHWILAGDVRQLSPFTDEGSVETALDLFSGSESTLNVTDTTKMAVALINESKLIIRHSSRLYAILVSDNVAKEIGNQLRKLDRRITEGIRAVYNEPLSYSDIYGGRVLFVGRSIFLNHRTAIPLDCYVINLMGESTNVNPENFHYEGTLDIDNDKDRRSNENKIKEDVENLRKTWSEGIAWRLNRDYWLRNLKKQRSTFIDEIRDRIPGEFNTDEEKKRFMNQCIRVVQNVVFHSILELLTVKNGDKDFNSLVQSFEPDELKLRSESLIYQHRMHQEISNTPAHLFYKRLENGPKVNETGMDYYVKGFKGQHNIWIDCSGRDWNNVNETEIDEIEKHLKDFVGWAKKHPRENGEEYTVIVLTFYLAQSNKMKERLDLIKKDARGTVRIKIATVDYIQGQEADVVFLSMVRNYKVGFMDTPNRLNVAITRAKHLLVFVGNKQFFSECKSIELNKIVEGCDVY